MKIEGVLKDQEARTEGLFCSSGRVRDFNYASFSLVNVEKYLSRSIRLPLSVSTVYDNNYCITRSRK